MMTRQSIDRLNGNCVCWVHDAWHHVSYIISKCIVLFPDACLLVWVWTFTQDSKGVVFYFVKMMQWDFPLSFPVMNLMNGNVFFPLFGVCVVCMWQCSLLFFLSILQPKLTSLICWHYRCVFCIVPQLQYFDMTKSQTISIKKIMANHNIVSLLNVFLAVYPPHRQTGFVFFFCPLVQHSPVLMDSVKLCGGGISPTAAYIFTGHCFLCEMQ